MVGVAATWSDPVAGHGGQDELLTAPKQLEERRQCARQLLHRYLVGNREGAVNVIFAVAE